MPLMIHCGRGHTVAGVGITGTARATMKRNDCQEQLPYCNHGVLVQENGKLLIANENSLRNNSTSELLIDGSMGESVSE